MPSDPSIARFIRDQLRRRISGPELALCEIIADGHEFPHESEDAHTFRRLKNEFNREISEHVDRSEPDLEGRQLLGAALERSAL